MTTSCWHSGCTMTVTSGTAARMSVTFRTENRPCTEQCPRHRIIRASRSCSVVRPPPGLRGSNTTQSSSDRPSCWTAVLRPEVLVGHEQHLAGAVEAAHLVERPPQRDVRVGRRADGAAVPARERLDRRRRVHVGHGHGRLRDAGVGQHVPRVLDLVDRRHVRHGAARREVRQDHLLVVRREDVRGLGHEVHAAEQDELGLGPRGGLARELERVARDVGELDDLVALVVVAQHERAGAERSARGAGPLDEVRVARCGQVADALDAALGGQVDTAAQQQEGRRSRLGEGARSLTRRSSHTARDARSGPCHDAAVRVLIAPDSFGSSLTAAEAAETIAGAWRTAAPHDEVTECPLSDGGPGFVATLHSALGGELVPVTVTSPVGDARPCGGPARGDDRVRRVGAGRRPPAGPGRPARPHPHLEPRGGGAARRRPRRGSATRSSSGSAAPRRTTPARVPWSGWPARSGCRDRRTSSAPAAGRSVR